MNAPLSKEQIALLMSDHMTVRSHPLPGTDGTIDDRAEPRSGFLSRLAAAVRTWTERRAVIAELRNLSDRDLADIGLNRADMGRVFDPAFATAREQAMHRAANA